MNPQYDWRSLPGTVSASHLDAFRSWWRAWREEGAVAEGDGVGRDDLDVWGRFAYDIVEQKAAARQRWLARGRRTLRQGKPLRLVLTGGAGSGKSTTVRALVRAQRERTTRRLGGAQAVLRDGKRKHVKMSCVLSAPTGTASFQMKYGATTAHRAWGVPIGFCGYLKRENPAFERLRELLGVADLGVFDEYSMLGKAFLGKILFRAREAEDPPSGLSLGGLDVILAGHLAQAAPIGDDPLYKPGAYKGKGLNKPPDSYKGAEPKTLAEFVSDARLFL